MSSISFPHGSGHRSRSPSASSSTTATGDYHHHHDGSGSSSSYLPINYDPTSSFQMNPLSAHPPRTPRTSIISSGYSMYESSKEDSDSVKPSVRAEEEEEEEEVRTEQESLEDPEEEKTRVLRKRVRREEVWRDIVATSNGRDKAFKLIQYSIRLYLFAHASIGAVRILQRPNRPPWEESLIKRLTSTMSGLSFTRKLLLLFNWLSPLSTITAQHSVPFSSPEHLPSPKPSQKPFVHSLLYAPPPVLLELVHALADDVYTFAQLGLLGRRTGEHAGRFSDWCWFLSTLVGLVENGVERGMIGQQQRDVESRAYSDSMSGATAKSQPQASGIDEKELRRLRREDYWLQVVRAKLVMDLIFVSYDLFHIKRARESVKTVTGLTAAILSLSKLYDRHRTSLIKSLTF